MLTIKIKINGKSYFQILEEIGDFLIVLYAIFIFLKTKSNQFPLRYKYQGKLKGKNI